MSVQILWLLLVTIEKVGYKNCYEFYLTPMLSLSVNCGWLQKSTWSSSCMNCNFLAMYIPILSAHSHSRLVLPYHITPTNQHTKLQQRLRKKISKYHMLKNWMDKIVWFISLIFLRGDFHTLNKTGWIAGENVCFVFWTYIFVLQLSTIDFLNMITDSNVKF